MGESLLPTITMARAAGSGLSRKTGRNSAMPLSTPNTFVSNNYRPQISPPPHPTATATLHNHKPS